MKTETKKEDYLRMVGGALLMAYHELREFSKKGENEIVSEGEAFGSLVSDIETKADKILGKALKEYFVECLKDRLLEFVIEGDREEHYPLISDAEVKSFSSRVIIKNMKKIFIDPLDGSLNFYKKGNTYGLPFCAVIALSDYSECYYNSEDNHKRVYQPCRFSSIDTAGIIDLRNADLWMASKGKGCTLNGKPCQTSAAKVVDLGKGIIIGDFYYPENRRLLCDIFPEKGWLRNCGSSAYEMALVASGQADAFICDRQKNHELGAAYLLVKEAGGAVVDFSGEDLGEKIYKFNEQTSVVVAATEELAGRIVGRIFNSSTVQ